MSSTNAQPSQQPAEQPKEDPYPQPSDNCGGFREEDEEAAISNTQEGEGKKSYKQEEKEVKS